MVADVRRHQRVGHVEIPLIEDLLHQVREDPFVLFGHGVLRMRSGMVCLLQYSRATTDAP